MSATTQLTTFSDLYTDLQNRARETTGLAATENQAKRYINIALQDMHLGQGEKFPWAERKSMLITQAKYTTGTVTITKGSTTLTGSGTAWATNNSFTVPNVRAGGKFVINGADEVYEVSSVSSDTSVVLTSKFVRDDVSAASYVYYEDTYSLATDFLRPISQQKFDADDSIDLIGRTEFRRRYPANSLPAEPRVATMGYSTFGAELTNTISNYTQAGVQIIVTSGNSLKAGDQITISGSDSYDGIYTVNSANSLFFQITADWLGNDATKGSWTRAARQTRVIRFHPPPDTARMIPYQYVTSNLAVTAEGSEQSNLSNDDDQPIVPLQYRHAILFHALSHWYRDKKDDARTVAAANEYTNIMLRIISDNEVGGARAQFRPRVGHYRSRAARPWRGSRGRYDINGKFDRMEW